MSLSAELFQSVVQALRVDEACDRANPGGSQLRARRIKLGGRAIVIACDGRSPGETVEAVARDISPSGIALILPLRLVRGDRFILHMPKSRCRPDSENACNSILCTVARYQHSGSSLFTLGATFTRVLPTPAAPTAPETA
jgi:hypothetical protein